MFRLAFLAAVLAVPAVAASAQGQDRFPAAFEYRSPYDGYRAWRSEPGRDWREVNAEVERLGGHAGHLRANPAVSGTPPAGAPESRAAPTAPAGHGGHHGGATERRR